MSVYSCLFAGSLSAALLTFNALAVYPDLVPLSHKSSTQILKPVQPHKPDFHSFQIAKSTFLPETFDDLGLSGYKSTNIYHSSNNNSCAAFPLSSCPQNAVCDRCPINPALFKFSNCKAGYKFSNGDCLPKSCDIVNALYKNAVPANSVCTRFSLYTLTCYKDCRPVNCSAYPLNCPAAIANAAEYQTCPDCSNPDANCALEKCKVGRCLDGYKAADDGASCILLDDTCPNGYFKQCETGFFGEPQYTELGSPCYKCQARTCSNGSLNLNVYWCDSALKCLLPAD